MKNSKTVFCRFSIGKENFKNVETLKIFKPRADGKAVIASIVLKFKVFKQFMLTLFVILIGGVFIDLVYDLKNSSRVSRPEKNIFKQFIN